MNLISANIVRLNGGGLNRLAITTIDGTCYILSKVSSFKLVNGSMIEISTPSEYTNVVRDIENNPGETHYIHGITVDPRKSIAIQIDSFSL